MGNITASFKASFAPSKPNIREIYRKYKENVRVI
jgi:hypothetical protein